MLKVSFPDGEEITGLDVEDSTISEVYNRKLELVKASGIDSESAKLVVLFPYAFPKYNMYFGGAYVAS